MNTYVRRSDPPTERILKLLETYRELVSYVEVLEEACSIHMAKEAFADLPPRPADTDYQLELQRQSILGSKTRANRLRMRKYRQRQEIGASPKADPAAQAAWDRAIAAAGEPTAEEILSRDQDTYAPPEGGFRVEEE